VTIAAIMSEKKKELPEESKWLSVRPPKGERVMVHCMGFNCQGYLDEDGKWKDAYRGRELLRVYGWSPLS